MHLNIVKVFQKLYFQTQPKTLGDYAFFGCSSLTTFVVNDGISGFTTSVFSGTSIKYLTFCGLWSIGDNAYKSFTTLVSIVFKKGITKIGNSAFRYCSNLKSISTLERLTELGSYAFSECTSLETIAFGNKLTTINSYAFYKCTSLLTLNLRKVNTIGSSAFYDCKSLNCIYYYGSSSVYIYSDAFYGIKATHVIVSDSYYGDKFGSLYIIKDIQECNESTIYPKVSSSSTTIAVVVSLVVIIVIIIIVVFVVYRRKRKMVQRSEQLQNSLINEEYHAMPQAAEAVPPVNNPSVITQPAQKTFENPYNSVDDLSNPYNEFNSTFEQSYYI
ncbi:leucine-rich-repeat family virulence factor BspA [Histomonas meleagridis]|nr:leucine-rich-repeat family virulence factor BspA [Histomonas meleagridis]